jgi:peptidyl-tRNA hydrolase
MGDSLSKLTCGEITKAKLVNKKLFSKPGKYFQKNLKLRRWSAVDANVVVACYHSFFSGTVFMTHSGHFVLVAPTFWADNSASLTIRYDESVLKTGEFITRSGDRGVAQAGGSGHADRKIAG